MGAGTCTPYCSPPINPKKMSMTSSSSSRIRWFVTGRCRGCSFRTRRSVGGQAASTGRGTEGDWRSCETTSAGFPSKPMKTNIGCRCFCTDHHIVVSSCLRYCNQPESISLLFYFTYFMKTING